MSGNYYIYAIRNFQRKPTNPALSYRRNGDIAAPELRVVDEESGNLGVMSRADALALAAERNLDLIEIAPTSKPPIAKLANYDKFRYQKEKEFKKQQQAQSKDLKQVQIGLKSARNDLLIRSKRIDEFLQEGYKVEIVMKLRGREKANKEWAKGKLSEFLELITENFKPLSEIKPSGSGFSIQIDKSDKKNG